jgi:DNA-binding Lrp family transcriptional regulator
MTNVPRLDEVLAELSRLERDFAAGPAGFTCRELSRRLDISNGAVQEKLREMFDAGTIELAGKREGLNHAGVRCRVPVYRLTDHKAGSCDPDKGSATNP